MNSSDSSILKISDSESEISSDQDILNKDNKSQLSSKKIITQITSLELYPDKEILESAISLASDKNVRISKLSDMILKDPVITLEILSCANSLSNEKASISAVQTGVIRIGSSQLIELLQNLKTRIKEDLDPDVSVEYSSLRRLGERATIVSEILSSHLQRDIIELTQTCALLSYIGPMILCHYFDREYLEVAHLRKRNALNYRMQSKYGFNYNEAYLTYLKARNLPSEIFFAFDKELKCVTSAQSSLRFIIESAIEIVEAYEDGKFIKYVPGVELPPKSALRLLKINEAQYATIYEEIEYSLGSGVANKEYDVKNDMLQASPDVNFEAIIEHSESSHDEAIKDNSDIEGLDQHFSIEEKVSSSFQDNSDLNKNKYITEGIVLRKEELMELISSSGSAVFIEKTSSNIELEKQKLQKESVDVIESIEFICKSAENSRSLLNELMSVITQNGPFLRAALIRINDLRNGALIEEAVGEEFSDINPPLDLVVNDYLSPLSTFCTKVRSFNSYSSSGIKDIISPFGISSYAISPIRLHDETSFVFYADCGEHQPLPLEARKVFRLIVAILNKELPRFKSEINQKNA